MQLLELSFEHDEPAGPMRQRARAVLESLYPRDRVEDALVVISELVQNVIQHTAGGGNLNLQHDDRTMVIEVRDRSAVLPHQQRPDQRRIGGRGLLLVAGMAREWGVRLEPGGKVVWAEITVDSARAVTA